MTKKEAEEAYRQAWMGWCLARAPAQKREFEKRMDQFQPYIARGPGPEWDAFTQTLPGFLEHWKSLLPTSLESG